MGAALLVSRLVLASVLLVAGVAKLADLDGSREAVTDFGVPERAARSAGLLLPLLELATALALIPLASARIGAIAAALLMAAFALAIGVALVQGRTPECHCFGQLHSAPASWRSVARNCVLLALACFVAIGGWRSAGVSATHWVTTVGSGWLVAIVAGLVIAGLLAFQVWFSLQLLAQNGRALARLDALEETLAAVSIELGIDPSVAAPRLGAGLKGGGLPIGSAAPSFELESVDGGRYSLDGLLSSERPLMLVFTSASCGPCNALMPDVAAWQRDHDELLRIVLMATGEAEPNRQEARGHRLERVLLDVDRSVSSAFQAHGTPMAVVIGTDGAILSPTVGGVEAVSALLAQAVAAADGEQLLIRHVAGSKGNRTAANGGANGNAAAASPARPPPPPPAAPAIGEPAPNLALLDMDGRQIELAQLYGERTVAIFWNPGCGFCQRMLPDLKALERDLPAGAPRLVVISAGDPERVRELELVSPVLFDSGSAAMRAFGAGGTPMGVLVEEGKIASRVVAGADAVFELIGH